MVKPIVFEFDSLESVHEEIQEGSPEPNIAAIEAHETEQVAVAKLTAGQKDSAGVVFDSGVHALNAEGDPSLTSTGKYRRKKGTSTVASKTQALVAAKTKQDARAAGQLAADLMINSAIMLGGPEWNPVGSKDIKADAEYDEHAMLRRAFADYFEAKGISDFPPGISLSIAVSGYMMPRFVAGKETKERVGKARTWFSAVFKKFKRKKDDASQPDNGDNGLGKNDTGKAASEPVDEGGAGRPST